MWKRTINRVKFRFQGKLLPKLILGTILTLSGRNGPNPQSYFFQAYKSLNPS